MTNTNWARWDKQRRTELGVPAAAWLRQTDPTKTELYFEGSTTPLVAIVREADDRWCCTLPDQVVFTGSAEHARELMWKAAAAAPTKPAAPARATRQRQRQPWNHLNRTEDD